MRYRYLAWRGVTHSQRLYQPNTNNASTGSTGTGYTRAIHTSTGNASTGNTDDRARHQRSIC